MLFHNDPCSYEASLLEETEAPYRKNPKQGHYCHFALLEGILRLRLVVWTLDKAAWTQAVAELLSWKTVYFWGKKCIAIGQNIVYMYSVKEFKGILHCFFLYFFKTLPAYKVSNDICVAHKDFHTVSYLINICSVDMFSKSSFNARAILKKLLKNTRQKNKNCNLCCFTTNISNIHCMLIDSIFKSAVESCRCTEDLGRGELYSTH